MWRKVLISLIFILGLTVSNVAAQGKSYSADRFDVDVVVLPGGTLQITETVTYTFVGEPFTFVFRELDPFLTDGVFNIQAGVDGQLWPEGTEPGQVELSGSDPINITWHLSPTSNQSRTFTLSYEMRGVVRQTDEGDLLRYQPLPDEFEFDIARSQTTFRLPTDTRPLTTPVITAEAGSVVVENTAVIVTAQDIEENETFIVEMLFPAGSLISEPPAWQQRVAQQNSLAPYWIGAALLTVLANLGISLFVRRRFHSHITPTKTIQYAMPSQLAPALAGAINGHGADATWPNALGTLFDLADRGILVIDEIDESKWYRKHDFMIEQVERYPQAKPHERALLDLLFAEKKKEGRSQSIRFSEVSGRVTGKRWEAFTKSVQEELKALGYYSPERKRQRNLVMSIGVIPALLSILFIVLAVAQQERFGDWPLSMLVALMAAGIIWLLVGNSLRPLTDEGLRISADWQGFFKYLKEITKGKAAIPSTQIFNQYLPYAATYGLLDKWAKWFEKNGEYELPSYFRALSAAPGDSMAAFVAMTSVSNSAGGSAAGGGGGGGAAGGGGAGAG